MPIEHTAAGFEEFLLLRRNGIGASDMPALLGVSPWKTAFEVYLDKVNNDAPRQEESDAMRWGRKLEGFVGDFFSETMGVPISGDGLTVYAKDGMPHMQATPDRIISPGRGLEIKTSRDGRGWGESGTDDVPEHVKIQVLHQCEVMGWESCVVAVLIAGSEFRWYEIAADAKTQKTMACIADEFWCNFVRPKQHPPFDYEHPRALHLMARLFGFEPESVVMLTESDGRSSVLENYLAFAEAERNFRRMKDSCKAQILALMGDAGRLVGSKGFVARRAKVSRRGYTVAPCDYIKLTVSPPKEDEDGGNQARTPEAEEGGGGFSD